MTDDIRVIPDDRFQGKYALDCEGHLYKKRNACPFRKIEAHWKPKALETNRGGVLNVRIRAMIAGKLHFKELGPAVLEAFGQKRPSKRHRAYHLDQNPKNNQLLNLKWFTRKQYLAWAAKQSS